MKLWLEIHCDANGLGKDCPVYTGNYPSALASTPAKAYAEAAEIARQWKWVRLGGNWYCRACMESKK